MTTHPRRMRLSAATVALCGLAAVAVTGCAAGPAAASQAATASQAAAASSATASQQHGIAPMGLPSLISCTRQAQIRPGRYTLACADGNAYLSGLYWAAWGSGSAFATGTDAFNTCVPTCPAGHLHSYPVLAVLWRAEPLPGHPGERYFTRLTIIGTGAVSYRAGGKTYRLPVTVTDPLVPTGGA
jgi:hypothetical protein